MAGAHDALPGVVHAAIVNEDEFDARGGRAERGKNLLGERKDIRAFIPQRHND